MVVILQVLKQHLGVNLSENYLWGGSRNLMQLSVVTCSKPNHSPQNQTGYGKNREVSWLKVAFHTLSATRLHLPLFKLFSLVKAS